ncbi:MAG: hypothetical protein ETSY2_45130 [Candidatus Entotheonella gemina]|uniref:Uncharacterized protein n=1 Tax=Candidatus Entotheonella gemina TaxID=1429439 RepID=W4LHF5_9BACT|nr:MAG: hypothetical protein ETSY2_45130 [Candidatus Entotheonella gemina]
MQEKLVINATNPNPKIHLLLLNDDLALNAVIGAFMGSIR